MSSYKDFDVRAISQAIEGGVGPRALGRTIGVENAFVSTFPNEFRSSMSEYQNAIVFGNKNFLNIVEDFQNEIDKAMKEIDDYLDRAEAVRTKIQQCMRQDIAAKQAAEQKYNEVMNEPHENYMDDDGNEYDEAAHIAAASAAAQAVWEDQRCDLWG